MPHSARLTFSAVAFNPADMKVFDSETGDCLTRDDARAAEIARDNEEPRKAALERARSRGGGGANRRATKRGLLTGAGTDVALSRRPLWVWLHGISMSAMTGCQGRPDAIRRERVYLTAGQTAPDRPERRSGAASYVRSRALAAYLRVVRRNGVALLLAIVPGNW